MIVMIWKVTDRPAPSTTVEIPTIDGHSTSATPSTLSPVSTDPPQLNTGLTNKVKVIIGVVVPVIVLAGGAIFIMLLSRGRQKRLNEKQGPTGYTKPELDASNHKVNTVNQNRLAELTAMNEIREIDSEVEIGELGVALPHELAAPTTMHELEGSGCKDLNQRAGNSI